MTKILWFGMGAVAATLCFIAVGIVMAKRERKVKFLAGVLLPGERALMVRLLTKFRTLAADEHAANLEMLRHLGVIRQVGDADILTSLGRRVAARVKEDGP